MKRRVKLEWNCWTGIAEYDFEVLDETGRWLLGVGRFLGAGAKASFGCGFFANTLI